MVNKLVEPLNFLNYQVNFQL